MKELLLQYAQYNVWANNLIIDALLKLETGLVDQKIASSFPSLHATVCHTWSAEYMWLQRLQLVEQPTWVQGTFTGTFEEACYGWKNVSGSLAQYVEDQSDNEPFKQEIQFYDRSKAFHEMPVHQILLHVFNHSTYHRGQLVTMLRQLGAEKIPGMDFVLFAREKN